MPRYIRHPTRQQVQDALEALAPPQPYAPADTLPVVHPANAGRGQPNSKPVEFDTFNDGDESESKQ